MPGVIFAAGAEEMSRDVAATVIVIAGRYKLHIFGVLMRIKRKLIKPLLSVEGMASV